MSIDGLSVLSSDREPGTFVLDTDVLSGTQEDETSPNDHSSYNGISVLDSMKTSMYDDPILYPTATDDSVIKFTDTIPKVTLKGVGPRSNMQTTTATAKKSLVSATVAALIVELTSPKSIDYQFLLDFFLTYRMFLKTETLAEILLSRFYWAFKTTLSTTTDIPMEKIETGKLVLIRCFVTIRHWLLNYFQDDFINNTSLKTMFVSFINELCERSVRESHAAVSDDQKANIEITTRILLEMKKVYINLCSIYWSTIPLEHIDATELLTYPLNAYEHMNSTRLSVMGLQQTFDPTFRNSGILSLYNSNSNSATNLLLQKHNENKQKNVAHLLHMNKRNINMQQRKNTFKIYADNDKRFLHPKDSLTSLKKSYDRSTNQKTPFKPTLTNIIKEEIKYTPLEGVKRLSKNELADQQAKQTVQGFVTNGNIGVFTDSKIHKLIPVTPEKPKIVSEHQTLTKSNVATATKRQSVTRVTFQEPVKSNKSGLGRLVVSWKKHFHKQKIEHKEFTPLIENVSNLITQLPRTSSQSTLTNMENKLEGDNIPQDLDVRVDILSARIIQEFHYLLNDKSFQLNLSKELLNKTHRRKSVFSLATMMKSSDSLNHEFDVDDDDDDDQENTFNVSPTKKFDKNQQQNDLESFRAPSVSFNWTDSFNNTTNDDSNEQHSPMQNIVPSMINGLEDEPHTDDTSSSDMEQQEQQQQQTAAATRMSMKSYISYDSAISRTDSIQDLNNLIFHDAEVRPTSIGSQKSYLSYDSALSAQLQAQKDKDSDEMSTPKLKKKLPFQNLKSSELPEETIPVSTSSHFNIALARPELHNLVSFKDLPYCFSNVSASTTNILKRDSSSFFEIEREYRLSVQNESEFLNEGQTHNKQHHGEGLTIQSIDDDSSADEVSVADYESTLSRIEGTEQEPEDIAFDTGSHISMIPSNHSSVIMPFPGLDSAAIAELAAIPDDSFNGDPIAAALMKLEGKFSKEPEPEKGRVIYGLNDEVTEFEDEDSATQSSIDEINLQNKVRDLFITMSPGSPNKIIKEVFANEKTRPESKIFDASTPFKKEQDDRQEDNNNNDNDDFSTHFELEQLSQPTLESILESNSHISLILSYDSQRLANHLTLIEKDALLEIDWKELIELDWDKTVEPINSWLELLLDEKRRKGVNLVISRFNLMINWICSEILLTSKLQERKAIISRCIHIAQHCKKLQNYATVMQIILALTSVKVSKLTETWNAMDANDVATLKNLEKLASPFKNFANLRNETNKIVPSRGCIPFLGLYLSDLTFNAERPNFFNKDNPNDSTTSFDKSIIEDSSESTKLINFAKFRTSASVVRSLIQCIEWSKLYHIDHIEPEIISRCLYIKSLTDEEMNICIAKIGEIKTHP